MNGTLAPTARQPAPNWGDQPNAGYDLTGATTLQFWVRGAKGGEVVHFFAFGVGNTAYPFQPYPDSSAKVEVPTGAVKLTTDWTLYQIPLARLDLHYVLGGFGWVANTTEQAGSTPITFYIDNVQFLKVRPPAPHLLVSYETIKSTNSFDMVLRNAAYVYDNAVALIALIGTGDIARATSIADAFAYAINHDRFFTDGRVRNAYQGGDISLPPGWLPNNLPGTVRMPGWYDPGHTTWFEDATQVSTSTGNVAWAALGLLNAWEVTKNPEYLTAARSLGKWVLTNASETRGGSAGLLGGFTGGYDGWENSAASGDSIACASGVIVNGQCKRLYKSTEHNIDLYSVFSRLYLADPANASMWANGAQQAKHFFLSMWNPNGNFWTGTTEDGMTVSTDVVPVDIQAWALEALGTESQAYWKSLAYAESHHKTSLGYGFKQDSGNPCGDKTWFEGTSQVAVAYLVANNKSKWQSILDGVHTVQVASGGVPATDGACLNTGFFLDDGSPWEYFPRIHVGATGWLALAENSINPYRPELYSPQLSSSAIAFGNQVLGSSISHTVSITNPGVGPLAFHGIAIGGSNAADFSQSNNCPTSLLPGAACTITISFAPTSATLKSALLTISESSDPAMNVTPLSVNLIGNGVPLPVCSYTLTPASQRVAAAGGIVTVAIAAPSGCTWTVSGLPTWIAILPGGSSSGTGSSNLMLNVLPDTGGERSDTFLVDGAWARITQTGSPSPWLPRLFWQNDATRDVTVWFMGGPQGSTQLSQNWVGFTPGWTLRVSGDMNGDGVPDLLWQNDTTRDVTVWFMGGPQGGTQLSQNWVGVTPGWTLRAAADMNGDGVPDLLWQNDNTRDVTVWFMGGPQGSMQMSQNWVGVTPGWTLRASADLNGDGIPDLLWQNDTTRDVTVWFMGGSQGSMQVSQRWIGATPGWSLNVAQSR